MEPLNLSERFNIMFGDLLKRLDARPVSFTKDFHDFRVYAIIKHGEQKYGRFPYSVHLAATEAFLVERGFDSFNHIAAAWLHDIVEDTTTSYDMIAESFGFDVAGYVYCLTGEGDNRKERNESIYKKIAIFPQAAVIKAADRAVNMHYSIKTGRLDKLAMYVNEWSEFSSNLRDHVLNEGALGRILWSDLEEIKIDAELLVAKAKEEAKAKETIKK